ncbi:unnamed protein product [Amoebophrya sp. A120]|nr:unnamed protein product [Amoebophrya sp. A120]|eukprot:GSA120T00013014001.1
MFNPFASNPFTSGSGSNPFEEGTPHSNPFDDVHVVEDHDDFEEDPAQALRQDKAGHNSEQKGQAQRQQNQKTNTQRNIIQKNDKNGKNNPGPAAGNKKNGTNEMKTTDPKHTSDHPNASGRSGGGIYGAFSAPKSATTSALAQEVPTQRVREPFYAASRLPRPVFPVVITGTSAAASSSAGSFAPQQMPLPPDLINLRRVPSSGTSNHAGPSAGATATSSKMPMPTFPPPAVNFPVDTLKQSPRSMPMPQPPLVHTQRAAKRGLMPVPAPSSSPSSSPHHAAMNKSGGVVPQLDERTASSNSTSQNGNNKTANNNKKNARSHQNKSNKRAAQDGAGHRQQEGDGNQAKRQKTIGNNIDINICEERLFPNTTAMQDGSRELNTTEGFHLRQNEFYLKRVTDGTKRRGNFLDDVSHENASYMYMTGHDLRQYEKQVLDFTKSKSKAQKKQQKKTNTDGLHPLMESEDVSCYDNFTDKELQQELLALIAAYIDDKGGAVKACELVHPRLQAVQHLIQDGKYKKKLVSICQEHPKHFRCCASWSDPETGRKLGQFIATRLGLRRHLITPRDEQMAAKTVQQTKNELLVQQEQFLKLNREELGIVDAKKINSAGLYFEEETGIKYFISKQWYACCFNGCNEIFHSWNSCVAHMLADSRALGIMWKKSGGNSKKKEKFKDTPIPYVKHRACKHLDEKLVASWARADDIGRVTNLVSVNKARATGIHDRMKKVQLPSEEELVTYVWDLIDEITNLEPNFSWDRENAIMMCGAELWEMEKSKENTRRLLTKLGQAWAKGEFDTNKLFDDLQHNEEDDLDPQLEAELAAAKMFPEVDHGEQSEEEVVDLQVAGAGNIKNNSTNRTGGGSTAQEEHHDKDNLDDDDRDQSIPNLELDSTIGLLKKVKNKTRRELRDQLRNFPDLSQPIWRKGRQGKKQWDVSNMTLKDQQKKQIKVTPKDYERDANRNAAIHFGRALLQTTLYTRAKAFVAQKCYGLEFDALGLGKTWEQFWTDNFASQFLPSGFLEERRKLRDAAARNNYRAGNSNTTGIKGAGKKGKNSKGAAAPGQAGAGKPFFSSSAASPTKGGTTNVNYSVFGKNVNDPQSLDDNNFKPTSDAGRVDEVDSQASELNSEDEGSASSQDEDEIVLDMMNPFADDSNDQHTTALDDPFATSHFGTNNNSADPALVSTWSHEQNGNSFAGVFDDDFENDAVAAGDDQVDNYGRNEEKTKEKINATNATPALSTTALAHQDNLSLLLKHDFLTNEVQAAAYAKLETNAEKSKFRAQARTVAQNKMPMPPKLLRGVDRTSAREIEPGLRQLAEDQSLRVEGRRGGNHSNDPSSSWSKANENDRSNDIPVDALVHSVVVKLKSNLAWNKRRGRGENERDKSSPSAEVVDPKYTVVPQAEKALRLVVADCASIPLEALAEDADFCFMHAGSCLKLQLEDGMPIECVGCSANHAHTERKLAHVFKDL